MNMVFVAPKDRLSPQQRPKLAIFLQRVLWKSVLKSNFAFFFYSNPCENIASLAVAMGVAKEKNVLDNGQTNNIFTRVTMEEMSKTILS